MGNKINWDKAWMVLNAKGCGCYLSDLGFEYLTLFACVTDPKDMQIPQKAWENLHCKSKNGGSYIPVADSTFIVDNKVGRPYFDPETYTFCFKSEGQKKWCLEKWNITEHKNTGGPEAWINHVGQKTAATGATA